MATCSSCGKNLGIVDRFERNPVCSACRERDARARADARTRYRSLLGTASATSDLTGLARSLSDLEPTANWGPGEAEELKADFCSRLVQGAIADGLLSEAEESQLTWAAATLGVGYAVMLSQHPDLSADATIARVNAGRLPVVPAPSILLKRGETDHLETDVQLLKSVTDRQWQAGYSGVSFRIAKGVRFNTGSVRGHSVVTGSHLEGVDAGSLVVTNQRVVFTGSLKTIELPIAKVVATHVYSDAIAFSMSNRQTQPLFATTASAVIAAIVHYLASA
jgi:hypothetical protein